MPMYQFRCPNGHEFEKLVKTYHSLYKWCKYCDKLTVWEVNLDPSSDHYKEKLCSKCLGGSHNLPMLSPDNTTSETAMQKSIDPQVCPTCGQQSEHIMRIEKRGSRAGGSTIADSSVRFHFNYMPTSDT